VNVSFNDAVCCCSRLGHSPLPPSPIGADYDEFSAVRLEDIEVIATLGMGGFGRVELVCKQAKFNELSVCLYVAADIYRHISV